MNAVEAIAAVLLEHRDSGITTVTSGQGDDEHVTGASAWCYCGGVGPGLDWMTRGPVWRGTFNLPDDGAERELCQHIAEAVAALADLIGADS